MRTPLCLCLVFLAFSAVSLAQTMCSSMGSDFQGTTGINCGVLGYCAPFPRTARWVVQYSWAPTECDPATKEETQENLTGIGVCGFAGTIWRDPDFTDHINIVAMSFHHWWAESQNYGPFTFEGVCAPVPTSISYSFDVMKPVLMCGPGCGCSLYCGFECMDDYQCPPGQVPYCRGDREGWIECAATPLVIDPLGQGFHLTSAQDGVEFPLMVDGPAILVAWTDPDYSNAWLALDRNGNGMIDDASELFGNNSPQPASSDPNGYRALAVFDERRNGGNANAKIDRGDAVFSRLRLWVDRNHDGRSHPLELIALPSAGVFGIDLAYFSDEFEDEHGNVFRYQARIWNRLGRSSPWSYDVYLRTAP